MKTADTIVGSAAPRAPETEDRLPFSPRQPMVDWFHPAELARAGVLSVMAKMFGAYADNREIQALRPARHADGVARGMATGDYSALDEVWVDYVADLGDGWDPTYAVACLLAQDIDFGARGQTRRGRVLVMGGDQVYPTGTREEYANRLVGPYRCALPWVDEAKQDPPHLYAVPGNHDWYDGLTSFTRVFCQGRWLGGWKTQQSRSYFALKLPHDWWLWGIDIQLNADIDEPQLDYFRNLAASMKPGSKIILCVAEPAWVTVARTHEPSAYDRIAFFEAETMKPFGHEHVIGLAGDLHAYARYADERRHQRFISGGGGAYLYPTHRLPESIELVTGKPTDSDRGEERYRLQPDGVFPPKGTSRLLALRSLLFPWYSARFALVLGVFYAFIGWLLNSATGAVALREIDGYGDAVRLLGHGLLNLPNAALSMLLLFAGTWAFADAKGLRKLALGTGHWLLHMLALAATILAARTVQYDWWPVADPLLFTAVMVLLGTVLAGAAWGVYLILAHLQGDVHSNEVLLCQRRPDFKHFLRLHVAPGGVTIYPIGLERVPSRWTYKPGSTNGERWYDPVDADDLQPVLIEDPIVV